MEIEHSELVPVSLVLVGNIDILEVEFIGRDVNLDVLTALELKMLSLRKLDCELLDEGGNVVVADDLTFEFLDAECGVRDDDGEILLHLHLAAQSPMVVDLLAVEEAHLCREDGTAAFSHTALALSAVTLSTAG